MTAVRVAGNFDYDAQLAANKASIKGYLRKYQDLEKLQSH